MINSIAISAVLPQHFGVHSDQVLLQEAPLGGLVQLLEGQQVLKSVQPGLVALGRHGAEELLLQVLQVDQHLSVERRGES